MKAVYVIVLILNANFRHILRMDICHLLLSSLVLQQWAAWKAGKVWVQNPPFVGYKILQSISPHQLRKDKDNDNMSQKPMSRNWEEARVFRRVQSHCWDEEPQGGNGRGQWCRESGGVLVENRKQSRDWILGLTTGCLRARAGESGKTALHFCWLRVWLPENTES